jgi:hypothetical protein
MIEVLLTPWALASLLVPVLLYVYSSVTARSTIPKNVPWVGLPSGLFAQTRAKFSNKSGGRARFGEIWEKVHPFDAVT